MSGLEAVLKERLYHCYFRNLIYLFLFIFICFLFLPFMYVPINFYEYILKSLHITTRFALKFFVDNTVIFGLDIGLRQATGEAIFLISQN